MRYWINVWLLLICLPICNCLAAIDKFYINKLNHCKITKSISDDYEPEIFQPTNNLLRASGQNPVYCGTKIIIKGRVLDQNCVPVSDAKVYLWQVGCDGKYPYKTLRTAINKDRLNLRNGSSFQGSGTATTNNQGEFYFITIYPAAYNNKAPNVNLRIVHRDLGSLQTKLFPSKNNIIDSYEELSGNLAAISENTTIYSFDLVIPGETSKRY